MNDFNTSFVHQHTPKAFTVGPQYHLRKTWPRIVQQRINESIKRAQQNPPPSQPEEREERNG